MTNGLKLSLVALALLQVHVSNANAVVPPVVNPTHGFYFPRVTGQFLTGNRQQLGGFGDVLAPFMINPNGLVFADGGFMLGQDQRSTLSGGLGYRHVYPFGFGPSIVGAYVFTDYYHSALKNEYWQLNPGLELLGPNYEARLQGYIPLGNRNRTFRSLFASAIPGSIFQDSGRNNFNLYGARGHSIFDTPVNLVEAFGPGIELEVGRFFDVGRGFWARVGGYHFSYNGANDINGVEANIEAMINNNVSLLLQNNYDNQNKNRFSVGLRVTFGGTSSAPVNTLENRITSPIIRHIARQSYGEALPSRRTFALSGQSIPIIDNIWFFSPNGAFPTGLATTPANCTAENPCLTIDSPTAARINELSPNANLFFASGNYYIPVNPLNQSNWAMLQPGQTIFGRDPGWLTPASGLNRPLINGGLLWGSMGFAPVVASTQAISPVLANAAIYDMRIFNANQTIPANIFSLPPEAIGGGNSAVIGLAATGNIFAANTEVQAINTLNPLSSAIGFAAGQNAFLGNITSGAFNYFNVSQQGADISAVGIFARNNALVVDSTVSSFTAGPSFQSNAQAAGVINFAGDIYFINSKVGTMAIGNSSTDGASSALGIESANNAVVMGSEIYAISRGDAVGAEALSAAVGVNSVGGSVLMADSKITVGSSGSAFGGGNTSAAAVASNKLLSMSGTTINVFTGGNATDAQSLASAVGAQASGDALIATSTINGLTLGSAANGGVTSIVGVSGSSATSLDNTVIQVTTRGNADGVESKAAAVGAITTAGSTVLQNSVISANTFGNATNSGISSANGVVAQEDVAIINSTVSANTSGNAEQGGITVATAATATDNDVAIINSTLNAGTRGSAANGGNSAAVGALGNTSVNIFDSTVNVTTHGSASDPNSTSSAIGAQSTAGLVLINNSTINTQTFGFTGLQGNASAIGVLSNQNAFVLNSRINSITNGSGAGAGSLVNAIGIRSVNGDALVNNSVVNVSSHGDALEGGNTSAIGVFANNINVNDSSINVFATGDAEGTDSVAGAVGLTSQVGNVNVTRSFLNVITSGSATEEGNTSAQGIVANNNVEIDNSTISVASLGNATGEDSFALALAVRAVNGSATLFNSTVNALTQGIASLGGETSANGVFAQINTLLSSSKVNAISFGNANGADSNAGATAVKAITGSSIINGGTIFAQSNGNASNVGNNTAIGVTSAAETIINNSTVTAQARGNTDNNGTSNATAVIGMNTIIEGSIVNAFSSGNSTLGGSAQVTAVQSLNDALIANSILNANSTGDASNNGNNSAKGVSFVNDVTVEGSIIRAQTNGNVSAIGNNSATAITGGVTGQNITITNSNVAAITTGNVDGLGSVAVASAVESLTANATINDSFIGAVTTGAVTNGGLNSVLGVFARAATITNSTIEALSQGVNGSAAAGILAPVNVTFAGNAASYVTAISPSVASPIITGSLVNGSTPKSKCSIDGVNFVDC